MESGVVTVLFFCRKKEGNPSSHFMTFGTPSHHIAYGFVYGGSYLPLLLRFNTPHSTENPPNEQSLRR